jgi:hypothetical protein
MASVHFTQNLQRHVDCPMAAVPGRTVAEVLGAVFSRNPRLKGYILDERGMVRKHMAIFVDGRGVTDRERMSDAVGEESEIYVMQALSGG